MSIRLASAAIFLIAALYAWTAQDYTASFGDVLGPSVFPVMVGIPAMALALSLVVFPGGTTSWPLLPRLFRQAMALAALLGYALLLEPLGFPLATAAVIAAVAVVLDGPVLKSLMIGVAGSLSLWVLFDQLLGLPIDFFGTLFGG
ncbi:tripartite tricarboxylate transporter TctB family protein [Oceaniovalibus sp. ACAM 378]|uniref:tripartite tricarboxylate transporter TctB family protein n=1 Tax=Oceaniovalibus sp. ACAM 378 TaxID=2599923 RepID=UPI0011DA9562|nr:tripartite tricarboxylate transporter TctB family protein [Oceaniovalibus sp. ACAM 378]TYB90503.1 tripartite tricarboxylate transporter TctB family protein [Oceaniovalibus sp. ACAM 378]